MHETKEMNLLERVGFSQYIRVLFLNFNYVPFIGNFVKTLH